MCKLVDDSNTPLNKTVEILLESVLAEETTDGTGCDNMSCIIVRIKSWLIILKLIIFY